MASTPKARLGRLGIRAGLLVSSLLVAFGLLSIEHLFAIEHRFHDRAMEFWALSRERVATNLAIVQLTDESVAGRSLVPFPRDVLAAVISELSKAKPKAIVLDIFLTGPESSGDDLLASALRSAGNVYLAQPVALGSDGELRAVPLLPKFESAARGVGLAAFSPDGDRVVREVQPWIATSVGRRRSLPLVLAEIGAPAKGDLREEVPIDFHAMPGVMFRSYPAEGLVAWHDAGMPGVVVGLEDAVGPNTIAFVGPYHSGSTDFVSVPLITKPVHGSLPGTELLAYATATLQRPVWPSAVSTGLGWFAILGFFVAAFGAAVWGGHVRWLLVSFGVLLVYLAAAFWLMALPVYLPVGTPVVAWVLGWHTGESYRHGAHARLE